MNKDGFLDRWSQRKLAVEQENADADEAVVVEISDPAPIDEEQGALRQEGEADLIESEIGDDVEGEGEGEEQEPHPAEGIDIDELEYDSDFTVFMNDKVPEKLRRMALRKLWRSNPILANLDGLNDYDEDFTDAATVFINSAGDVISGVRDQFWDDKQIAEGKDKIGADESDEEEEETAEADENETEDIDDTEVVESGDAEVENIEDADVEEIEDFDDMEIVQNDRGIDSDQNTEEAEETQEVEDSDKSKTNPGPKSV